MTTNNTCQAHKVKDVVALEISQPSLSPWEKTEGEKTIAVLMSGGVDSSLTAALLKDKGWSVIGITMKIPQPACSQVSPCCGDEAIFVCQSLGIPHYFVHTEEVFQQQIIKPFQKAYSRGCTPNPCIDCNTILKFNLVWECIEKHFGVFDIATGHYARIIYDNNNFFLGCAKDLARDQSYFIYGIPRSKLANFHLPLGIYHKDKVRELAEAKNLHTARRPDSMELCFASQGDYRQVLGEDCRNQPGPIVDLQGKVLGEHQGIWNYTIGQRKGLGFAADGPRYVLQIISTENKVVVGSREDGYNKQVKAEKINVLIPQALQPGSRLRAKIRSLASKKLCQVISFESEQVVIEFVEAQFGITPGQHLVIYDDEDRVVAGGVIMNITDV